MASELKIRCAKTPLGHILDGHKLFFNYFV